MFNLKSIARHEVRHRLILVFQILIGHSERPPLGTKWKRKLWFLGAAATSLEQQVKVRLIVPRHETVISNRSWMVGENLDYTPNPKPAAAPRCGADARKGRRWVPQFTAYRPNAVRFTSSTHSYVVPPNEFRSSWTLTPELLLQPAGRGDAG